MPMTREQIAALLQQVADNRPDPVDCDGCFDRLAEFAELRLADQEVPEALRAVETHLEQCFCCQDEYRALCEALRAAGEGQV